MQSTSSSSVQEVDKLRQKLEKTKDKRDLAIGTRDCKSCRERTVCEACERSRNGGAAQQVSR